MHFPYRVKSELLTGILPSRFDSSDFRVYVLLLIYSSFVVSYTPYVGGSSALPFTNSRFYFRCNELCRDLLRDGEPPAWLDRMAYVPILKYEGFALFYFPRASCFVHYSRVQSTAICAPPVVLSSTPSTALLLPSGDRAKKKRSQRRRRREKAKCKRERGEQGRDKRAAKGVSTQHSEQQAPLSPSLLLCSLSPTSRHFVPPLLVLLPFSHRYR